jgi:predicted nucleotidyltransferase component of viral defense system
MIPIDHITEWSNVSPWNDARDVEQDLMICRALVSIYSDPVLSAKLAFRGGTAIHKLYLPPQARYSEDIDLIQIESEPIGETLDQLKKALSFMGLPRTKRKTINNVLLYTFESEPEPRIPRKLKIEINCKEHMTVLGHEEIPFTVDSNWFSGHAHLKTYPLDELVGTKIRALYQRKKGRDLFDLYWALKRGNIDVDRALTCFHEYTMFTNGAVPSKKMYVLNLEDKMADPDFRSDLSPILRQDIGYDIDEAFRIVKEQILDKI